MTQACGSISGEGWRPTRTLGGNPTAPLYGPHDGSGKGLMGVLAKTNIDSG